METRRIANQAITFHFYNTVIVGSGAAGINCAVHLYEFMEQKAMENPQQKIAVVTAGIGLGASRMSGSDKQTYYKIGTSPDVPDSAEEFARSLITAGCCHSDLALAEAIGSLREFYHLVQVGVPFPRDSMGSYVGYKTDNDPYERATSAGPKTSKFMSECLQKQLERYGVTIYDGQEVVHLLTVGSGTSKRIAGVVTIDKNSIDKSNYGLNVYLGENIVLATGGPGELYKTSVYPKGQVGIHGLAFKAGLVAENLTESQFGLASIKFRWNVSGSYMQAIPRIFSTDADGKDEREFLVDFFPSTSSMATNIFLKGYQWPFDPQHLPKIRNSKFEIRNSLPEAAGQSSLIDILVFNQMQEGRRVFLDFLHNPIGKESMKDFNINDLEPEAYEYLKKVGALQDTPIKRLFFMNPLAIEIYKEHGIDLYSEPLEVAVCAQHNNGGFAVDKWWQSNIPHTFIIGEMAGTHGVRRPGGSALNAGQVGGLRAAEYIVNLYGCELPDYSSNRQEIEQQLTVLISKLDGWKKSNGLSSEQVIDQIQSRMTNSAGHIRQLSSAQEALKEAVKLYKDTQQLGFRLDNARSVVEAIQAEHLALTSVAYLKAIVELLEQDGGSRGSYLVLAGGGIDPVRNSKRGKDTLEKREISNGVEIHPDIVDKVTGKPLRFKPENGSLRNSISQIEYNEGSPDLFRCRNVKVRAVQGQRKAFELAWRDFREGKIYL